ncbi:MAG: hypothetical protein QG597_3966 [Actinomycetota bacterium]|nr:hypothetical protein [Actinomycetota bacterium]
MTGFPSPPAEIAACQAAYATGDKPERTTEKAAVKAILAELAARAPGHSVEVRVPPYAAVQVIPGVRHRRGTPPALVQLDARTLIALATGTLTWAQAHEAGAVRASGERSDLTAYFPLYRT